MTHAAGYRNVEAMQTARAWERQQLRRRVAVQDWFGRPNREPVPDFLPALTQGTGGGVGIFDEMLVHPKIAKAHSDIQATLAGLTVQVDPVPGETAEEALFRRACVAVLDRIWLDHPNGVGGMPRLLESLWTWYTHGIYAGEARWVDDPGTATGLSVELYPVHPSSHDRWVTDDDGRLVALRQSTQQGQRTIDADRIIWSQRGGVPGQFGGMGWLRPLAAPFGLWRSLMSLERRNVALHGGTLQVMDSPGSTEQMREELRAALVAWQVEGAPWLITPAKVDLKLHTSSAASASVREMLTHLDAYIDDVCGRAVASLQSAAHATRALGDVLASSEDDRASRELHLLLGDVFGGLWRWLAGEVNYHGRHPGVSLAAPPRETEAGGVATTELVAAVQGGLLTWTPADEAALRDRLDLPAAPGAEQQAAAEGVVE